MVRFFWKKKSDVAGTAATKAKILRVSNLKTIFFFDLKTKECKLS